MGALQLLLQNRAFRSLWSARVISFAGDALSLVALMLHVASTTGQALAVSLLLLAGDFAPALLSPLTGALSDRFNLKRVMISCELLQGALLLLIALVMPPLPLLLALVAARAAAGQVFLPASRAAVPALVPNGELETANSTLGFGTNASEACCSAGSLATSTARSASLPRCPTSVALCCSMPPSPLTPRSPRPVPRPPRTPGATPETRGWRASPGPG